MTNRWFCWTLTLGLGLCILPLAAADDTKTQEESASFKMPDGSPTDMLAAINQNVRQAKSLADWNALIATTEKVAQHKDATAEQKNTARMMGLSLHLMAMRTHRAEMEPRFLKHVERLIAENPDAEIAGTASAYRWNHQHGMAPTGDQAVKELFVLAKKFPKNNMVVNMFGVYAQKLKTDEEATAFLERMKTENLEEDMAAVVLAGRWSTKHGVSREASKESTDELFALAKKYPKNARVAGLFMTQLRKIREEEAALAFLTQAAEVVDADSPLGKRLGGMLINRKIMGSTMELAGPTLKGEKFDLKSYKGKVVLVDFWATWCGPCIGELPHVKSVYKKYHDKGFEIVGVSLDNTRDALEKFVAREDMPWVQIIFSEKDDMGWNSPLARKFGVNSIPATFLVGRDGKVIARDLRGEANLEKAVAEALAK